MKSPVLQFSTTLIAGALSLGLAQAAGAADYPSKRSISVVVPYSAGGGADTAARIIAEPLGEELKQTIVIENKAGASGSVGASHVARSTPDGYTVLFDASAFVINPVLRKLPYDAEKDFIPVSQAISVPNIAVVAANSPYNSLNEYIEAARSEPGKHTFASYGPGSLAQMIGELLKKETNTDIIHVPYKGGAPAMVDVMGGFVDIYFANASSSLGHLRAGNKLKALAVTSEERMKELPDVPTMKELGQEKLSVLEQNGFYLPAGTPDDVVKTLHQAIVKTLNRDDVRAKMEQAGLTPSPSASPEDYATFLRDQRAQWAEVVKANNISLQ